MSTTFGISPGDVVKQGVNGFLRQPLPLLAAGALTLGIYAVFGVPAQMMRADGVTAFQWLPIDLVGRVLAGTFALPWYASALAALDGDRIDFRPWLTNPTLLKAQFGVSFWFWAGVLFGERYPVFGIPIVAVLVVLFYAFGGFALADGDARNARDALGVSVRIGNKRRLGLFAFAGLFFMVNLFGAIAIGFGVNALTIALTVLGLLVTTSLTMVAGAAIYRALEATAEPFQPLPDRPRKAKRRR